MLKTFMGRITNIIGKSVKVAKTGAKMLLLVVDDKYVVSKKQLYEKELCIQGVVTVNSLFQAEKVISRQFSTEDMSIVINNILLDEFKIDDNDYLRKIRDNFDGAIILKVSDELLGLNLIRDGLITDFYLANEDSNIELESLKHAYKLATLKKRANNKIIEINKNLAELKDITKGN